MTHFTERGSAELVMLEQAHRWHQEWKEKLLAAVNEKQTIDADTISRDDCCNLGKWLYSDGQRYSGDKPAFQDLVLHHREFHMLTGAVAEIVNEKQYELAKTYLSNDAQLARSSYEVDEAITRLEAALVR
jgi:hypothetical protein